MSDRGFSVEYCRMRDQIHERMPENEAKTGNISICSRTREQTRRTLTTTGTPDWTPANLLLMESE